MSVFMWVFLILLLYASYIKIIGLLFRGKQHNRFFGTFLCTVVPVFGSVPTFIMASKFEKRVGGLAPKINDYVIRCTIIALQLLSVFMLFFPFFKTDGIYADGINLMIGLDVDGEVIFKPAYYMAYFVVFPLLSAVINAVDIKYNIRNVITYIFSLICSVTFFVVAFFVNTEGTFMPTDVLWIYCIIHTVIMILSVMSLVNVRNRHLAILEEEEEILFAPEDNTPTVQSPPPIPEGMYRCSKCGTIIKKGTVCSCREKTNPTLDKVMEEQSTSDDVRFCVYCRKSLNPGEKCDCMGDGFGISVKSEHYEGRRCKYCGQVLVGDSTCVCEKIMKKSEPVSEGAKPTSYFEHNTQIDMDRISNEMDELEKKIDMKFKSVQSSLSVAEKESDNTNN